MKRTHDGCDSIASTACNSGYAASMPPLVRPRLGGAFLPDVENAANAPPLVAPPDFARITVVTDAPCSSGAATALVQITYKAGSASRSCSVPADFVLLADTSGSMEGTKLEAVRDALLKVATMFSPDDRVSLVKFDDRVTQMTPLASLEDVDAMTTFRCAAMELDAGGGTDIATAMTAATAILGERRSRNPLARVLLLTDGQDLEAASSVERLTSDRSVGWTTLGFGDDHDAALLASVATHGQGSFTFVDRPDLLDEAMGAYLGDVTHVQATGVRLEVALPPGVAVSSVRAPGPHRLEGSVLRVDLGYAKAGTTCELLLELTATPDAAGALAFMLSADGDEGARVEAPTCALALDEHAAGADLDALHAAMNRECYGAAAAAVAAAACVEDARAAVVLARAKLVGRGVAESPACRDLQALGAALDREEMHVVRLLSMEGSTRALTQQDLMGRGMVSPQASGSQLTQSMMVSLKSSA